VDGLDPWAGKYKAIDTMLKENAIITKPIPGLIRQIAVPASVGFFFNTMYNVVDTYYGGMISTEALAALSLTFPVFFIVLALGTGISSGGTALIATALGADDRDRAQLIAVQGLTFGVMVGLIVTVVGLVASPFLFGVLGASGRYLFLSVAYMKVIFLGSLFFIINYMLNCILNALGNTKTYRNFLVVGFLLNVVLDPWFIYGGMGLPGIGFTGIAVATVLIQLLGCLYLGYRVCKTGLIGRQSLKYLRPRLHVYAELTRQGLPASVNMATVGLGMFVITYFISRFGREGVAAYGAALRVEQIALLPSIGLNIATLTIVAQNHGAGQFGRIREVLKKSLLYGGVLMAGGGVLVFAFSELLMGVFTEDPNVIEIGATYLKIDAMVLYAYVIMFVHVAALQGLKRPMYAVWLGLSRQIVAPVVVFYLLSEVLGWKLLGVWWGIFLVTWSAAIFTLFYARHIIDLIIGPDDGRSDRQS
jgi:putative MATE family efflux protein